jgi:hypothetical protein
MRKWIVEKVAALLRVPVTFGTGEGVFGWEDAAFSDADWTEELIEPTLRYRVVALRIPDLANQG